MVDVAKVRMFGIPIGTFRWDEQYDIARFELLMKYAIRLHAGQSWLKRVVSPKK